MNWISNLLEDNVLVRFGIKSSHTGGKVRTGKGGLPWSKALLRPIWSTLA